MKQVSVAIVGITYPNKAKVPTRLFELKLCQPGEPIELRPKPKNEFDEHAIAVFFARGLQLGYLPSERAVLIGSHLRRGVEVRAIFQGLDATVGWCRVAFNEEPALPSVADQTKLEVDGFYPINPASEWGA